MSHTQLVYPVRVKFIPSEVKWDIVDHVQAFIEEEEFEQLVVENCTGFDTSINWAQAEELQRLLTVARFGCRFMGPFIKRDPIATSNVIMLRLFARLEQSLEANMSNGPTKEFFEHLLKWMLEDLKADDKFSVSAPAGPSSSCVSKYINADVYEPNKSEEKVSSLEKEGSHFIVPDVVVRDMYVECFALNIEIKKPTDSEVPALVQCFTQMLSHMHNQDLHFGLLVHAIDWILIVAIKMGTKICVRQFKRPMYKLNSPSKKEDDLPVRLRVDSFMSMIKWIYCILSWYMKHE